MPRKKSKKRMYWDEHVEAGVIAYNETDDPKVRDKIYREDLAYAFDKLSESIINTFKFSYFDVPFEDVKQDVITFLVMNLHKFDHTKGSKSFSYFSVVAKNYLILNNNSNYKKFKTHDQLTALDNQKNKNLHEDKDYTTDLLETLITYFDQNIDNIFKKERDIKIANAIIDLMKMRSDIENFNKKALYILIREMTDVDTSKITAVTKVMKKHYKNIYEEFYRKGMLPSNHKKASIFFSF